MDISEIPTAEDIYDIGTEELEELLFKLKNEIPQQQVQNNEQFVKKAQKILDLAQLEIQERKQVENFGNFCTIEHEQNFFDSLEKSSYQPQKQTQKNEYLENQNLKQFDSNITNTTANNTNNNMEQYLDQNNLVNWQKMLDTLQSEQYKQQNYNGFFPQQELESNNLNIQDPEEDLIEHFQENPVSNQQTINTSSSKTTNVTSQFSNQKSIDHDQISHYSQNSIETTYANTQKKIRGQQSKKKQDEMYDFVKQVLSKTRITNEESKSLQQDPMQGVNLAAYGQYGTFEKQSKKVRSKSKSAVNLHTKNLPPKPKKQVKGDDEYKNVQSVIKQQMNKSKSTATNSVYFTTGKPTISNKYKPPPKPKVEDTRQHKSAYLKKRTGVPGSISNTGGQNNLHKRSTSQQSARTEISTSSSIRSNKLNENSKADLKVNQYMKNRNSLSQNKTNRNSSQNVENNQKNKIQIKNIETKNQNQKQDNLQKNIDKGQLQNDEQKNKNLNEQDNKNLIQDNQELDIQITITNKNKENIISSVRNSMEFICKDEKQEIIEEIIKNESLKQSNAELKKSTIPEEIINEQNIIQNQSQNKESSVKNSKVQKQIPEEINQNKIKPESILNIQTSNNSFVQEEQDLKQTKELQQNENLENQENYEILHQNIIQIKDSDTQIIQENVDQTDESENNESQSLAQSEIIEQENQIQSQNKNCDIENLNNYDNDTQQENQNYLKNQIQKKNKYQVNQIIKEENLEESLLQNSKIQSYNNKKNYYEIDENEINKNINNDQNQSKENQNQQDNQNQSKDSNTNNINEEKDEYKSIFTKDQQNLNLKDKMELLLNSIQDESVKKNIKKKMQSMEVIKNNMTTESYVSSIEPIVDPEIIAQKEAKEQAFQIQKDQEQNKKQQNLKQLEKENTKKNQDQEDKDNNKKQIVSVQPPFAAKKKKVVPQPSITNKLIQRMMTEISDDTLRDYTDIYPSFNHLFSKFYNNIETTSFQNQMINNQNFLHDSLIEQYQMFGNHYERLDQSEAIKQISYKAAMSSLEVTPSERYYMNDPQKVLIYQNKVGIDMRKFVERQIIMQERLQQTMKESTNLQAHEYLYFRVVKNKSEVYDIISRSFLRTRNWNELPHGMNLKTTWNLLWTWSKPHIDYNKLICFQKVNHFPFNKNLARKDLLKKNLERIRKLGQKANTVFDILPKTFILPKEYCNFSEQFYEDKITDGEKNVWIIKPIGKSRGRGISLINDISQVLYAEPIIVQKYLKNPMLLKGYKFDLRIYVLVTSFKPLEAFIYNEGFARISTEKYSMDTDTYTNNMIHLTNYSIQKHNVDLINQGDNIIGGTKITLRMLREQLQAKGIIWQKIWSQIEQICVKSLIACQQDIPPNPNCFEIFGYDVIIDTEQKCQLIEINTSPSLARDFIIDDLIKQQLIDDTMALVDPVNFDRQRLLEVLERRIKEQQGQKSTINTQNNSKLQLNRDLNYILRGHKIRKFGELPQNMGQYTRICPSEYSNKLQKLVQSYKTTTKNHTSIDL